MECLPPEVSRNLKRRAIQSTARPDPVEPSQLLRYILELVDSPTYSDKEKQTDLTDRKSVV